jgi:hypothetical protein
MLPLNSSMIYADASSRETVHKDNCTEENTENGCAKYPKRNHHDQTSLTAAISISAEGPPAAAAAHSTMESSLACAASSSFPTLVFSRIDID